MTWTSSLSSVEELELMEISSWALEFSSAVSLSCVEASKSSPEAVDGDASSFDIVGITC